MAFSEIAERWQIVFLHGLESGPTGRKARYLQEKFPGAVHVPDMEMSTWNPWKSNSPTRKLWTLFVLKGPLKQSLDDCVKLALTELDKLGYPSSISTSGEHMHRSDKKLMVIGSSWGGAVGLKCVERGLQPDRIVLLAPALGALGWWRHVWPPLKLSETIFDSIGQKAVTIVHGDEDDTVPVEGSRKLKERFSEIEYIELKGGDHRLNRELGISESSMPSALPLEDLVCRLAQQ